ncbi:MAG: DUF4340 domain-containing protein [Planctomycetes bacterium]|nr:DUF4340 domain-containing protein [Planctomycetota bacterium]
MSNSRLAILGIVALSTLGIAVQLARSPQHAGRKFDGPSYLIQGLAVEDIFSIELSDSEGKTSLARKGESFVVVDKGRYPADNTQVNDLITTCLDIKTVAIVSDDATNHADLGVTEETAKYVVKFLKEDGSLLGGVIVGHSKQESSETYVRLANRDEVFVADRSPYIRLEAIDYVNKELLSVKEEEIREIHGTSADGIFVLDANEGPDDLRLVNMPAGKTLRNSEAKLVLRALSSLRISDVEKGPRDDLDFGRKFICQLKNGIIYSLAIAEMNDVTFMTCSAEYVGAKVSMQTGKVDSEEELKEKEARLLAQEKSMKFQRKHENWVYTVPTWKANALKKDMGDLMEDVVTPTAGDEEGSSLAPFINLPETPATDPPEDAAGDEEGSSLAPAIDLPETPATDPPEDAAGDEEGSSLAPAIDLPETPATDPPED